MKKLIAAILCMALLLSCCTAVFADDRPDRNGYDPQTNSSVEINGICFQIPSYYTESETENANSAQYAGKEGLNNASILLLAVASASEANFTLTDANYASQRTIVSKQLFSKFLSQEGADLECTDITVAGMPGQIATEYIETDSVTGNVALVHAYSSEKDILLIGVFIEDTGSTQYSYMEDFQRIVEGAEIAGHEQSGSASAEGVTPSVKAALDSIEEFFDEYISFMESYMKNPTDFSLLMQYATFMTKYTEAMQKLEDMENDSSMTSADLAYYLEVYGRIMQKLANVISMF